MASCCLIGIRILKDLLRNDLWRIVRARMAAESALEMMGVWILGGPTLVVFRTVVSSLDVLTPLVRSLAAAVKDGDEV